MDKLGYDTYILEVKYLHFLYCFIAICSHCMEEHGLEIDIFMNIVWELKKSEIWALG